MDFSYLFAQSRLNLGLAIDGLGDFCLLNEPHHGLETLKI